MSLFIEETCGILLVAGMGADVETVRIAMQGVMYAKRRSYLNRAFCSEVCIHIITLSHLVIPSSVVVFCVALVNTSTPSLMLNGAIK